MSEGRCYAPFEVAHSQPSLKAMAEALSAESRVRFEASDYRRYFTNSSRRFTEEASTWARAWAYGYEKNSVALDTVAAEMYDFAKYEGFEDELSTSYMQMGALAAEAGRQLSASAAGAVLGMFRPFESYCFDGSTNVPRAPWLVQTDAELEVLTGLIYVAFSHEVGADRFDAMGAIMDSMTMYSFAGRCLRYMGVTPDYAEYASRFREWLGHEDPQLLLAAGQVLPLDELRSLMESGVTPDYGLLAYDLTV